MTQSVVITSVLRSQPPLVFSAQTIDGKVTRFVDKGQVLAREPLVGETWEITGAWHVHPEYGRQVSVIDAKPARPTGRLLVHTISRHEYFPGIGNIKAARLWDQHGEAIYALLDEGDVLPFIPTLGEELAEVLVAGWQRLGAEANTYRWLTFLDLPLHLAEKIIAIYSTLPVPVNFANEAKEVGAAIWHLQHDPYRMLTFASWQKVDDAARRLGVGADDPRRLRGGIEAALIARLQCNHTWTSRKELKKVARGILKISDTVLDAAIADAVEEGSVVSIEEGFQLPGCEIMERFCAKRLSLMAQGGFEPTQLRLHRRWTTAEIDQELDAFDLSEGRSLNQEQRHAIHATMLHRASLLLGGPGVGKTTTLKAIHHVAETMHIAVHQAALSGRASQRMTEASGRPASTIASLLIRVEKGEVELGDGVLLIIDESSMIDLGTLYRLMSALKPGVRALLVGDPGQLPPIGFGLTFQVLADDTGFPKTVLTKVMRQTAESGIPQVCADIRTGRMPILRDGLGNEDGVAFMDAEPHKIFDRMMDVLARLGGIEHAQIIGSLKRGPTGTSEINRRLQALRASGRELLCGRFYLGEPLIATRNDYDIGIMNGDLGVAMGKTKSGELEAKFGGRRIAFPSRYLPHVELAYAITCHKSQGSQFQRVIIPVTKSKLMDRALLLTAVSRGQKQVFLVGERSIFNDAIMKTSGSNERQTGFRYHLGSKKG